MKNRIPLIIVTGLLIVGIVLGSFFDLEINTALFSDRNGFSVFMSAFSLIPGYGFVAFIGGAFFAIALRGDYKKWHKAIMFVLAAIAYGAASYLIGNDFFSVNGYNIPGVGMKILGIGIAAVICFGFSFLGFKLSKNLDNKNSWIALLIMSTALIIALVPGVTVLKGIFHRPRFRTIQVDGCTIGFYNWWQPCKDYKDYIATGIISEEFKSFPSGHAGASMLTAFFLGYLPFFVPKLKKYQNWLFIIGIVYCGVVCFSRMLCGAHFLSDVCFGAVLTVTFMGISNEIIVRKQLI